MSFGGFNKNSNLVTLNVYDLAENQFFYPMGLGLYHSGVQVGRKEYTFAGGSGIFSMEPKSVEKFRESIVLGEYKGTGSVDSIIRELSALFQPNDYHLLNKNCNTFAEAFVWKLLQIQIPGFVNRMANIGSMFSCLLPESATGQAPVTDDNDQARLGNSSSSGGGGYGSSGGQAPMPNPFGGTGFRCSTNTATSSNSSSTAAAGAGGAESRRELARKAALNRI